MNIYKLNDLQVKNAEKSKKDYRLSDGGGLYLVVTSNVRIPTMSNSIPI